MNRDQAVTLCRLAKAAWPQQNIDDYTPDVWVLALEDDNFENGRQAIKELVREQPFAHLSEVCGRIKRIRARRIEAAVMPEPPDGLDAAGYQAWLGDQRRRIADGEQVERPALPGPTTDHAARRDAILAGVFRDVDSGLCSHGPNCTECIPEGDEK